jgi:hypothetical protein
MPDAALALAGELIKNSPLSRSNLFENARRIFRSGCAWFM